MILDLTSSDIVLSKETGRRTLFAGLLRAFKAPLPDWFLDATSYGSTRSTYLAHRVAETHIWNMMVEADTGCRQDQGFVSPFGAVTGCHGEQRTRSGMGVIMGTACALGIEWDGILLLLVREMQAPLYRRFRRRLGSSAILFDMSSLATTG